MHLELGTFPVKEVAFDTRAHLAGGILRVNPDEISSIVLEDERIKKVKIEVVRPGDDARILYLRDVVEPRIKVEGPGNVFPGILGGVDVVGSGKTHRLAGVAVMESVRTPEALFDTPELTEDQQLRTNAGDSFLDMAGPGALSLFTETYNIVLCLELKEGLRVRDFAKAVQISGLRVAAYLAETTRGRSAPRIEVFDDEQADSSLPGVVYIHAVRGAGLHHVAGVGLGYPRGPEFYGLRISDGFLTYVHPTEILDGALVEDGWVSGDRLTTWENLNNPIILDLLRRHGKDVNFRGMILMYIRYTQFQEKEMAACQAAKLAKRLGADGAIITWHRAGNAFVEPMLTLQECEKIGIKAVLVTNELGETEDEPPLLYYSPLAQSIISTGGKGRPTNLPRVERVVGGDALWLHRETGGSPIPAKGEVVALPDGLGFPSPGLGHYYGFTKRRCFEY